MRASTTRLPLPSSLLEPALGKCLLALIATMAAMPLLAQGAHPEAAEGGTSEIEETGRPLPPPIAPGRLDAKLARLAATIEMRGPLSFEPALVRPDRDVKLYARATRGESAALQRSIEDLGGLAARVGTDLFAVSLPARSLPDLARLPLLDRAEHAPPRRPMLDESIRAIGADQVVRGRGLSRALTGEGVILGLVDTGLDYKHPTFVGDDGHPRVLAVWDQIAEGEPPPGRTVGRLCEREDILDGSCPSLDIVGHGTHVAATAGGRDPSFPGVAPGVDFVSSGSLTFELLAEAAAWIFEIADQHDRPAVINMSLGGHYGAHDGSSMEEQALTEMSGPGRIIVVAAGNDGGRRIHLSYPLEDEPGRTDVLLYPGFLADGGFIDIWNEVGGEMEAQIALLDGSENVVAATGFRGPNDETFSGELRDDEDRIVGRVQLLFEPPHPDTGKERANVFLVPSSDPNTYAGNPEGLRWVLELRGHGTFHAWVASASFGSAPASFGSRGRAGDDESVVAMPGTAPGVITAAAYSTKNEWVDIDDDLVVHPSITVGDIAFFSSGGPAVDPDRTGMKPEIAAPGEFIAAPFGRNALIFDRSTMLSDDVAAMRGTSMAAPHVAGLVALLLEVRPELDREEIVELLAATAVEDEHTGVVPNDRWGYGKIDAHAAALALIGAPEVEEEGGGCGCSAAGPSTVSPVLFFALAAALLPRRRLSARRS